MSPAPKRQKEAKPPDSPEPTQDTQDFTSSASETIPVYTPSTIVGPPPDDYSSDDLEVDVSDQEEYVDPQKLESDDEPEVNNPVDIDYPVPDVQEGVPIPPQQERHPFHTHYAPSPQVPHGLAKLVPAADSPTHANARATRSPARRRVHRPEVPFALYSIIDHRGTSALLTPIHRELVAADRPDLLYIHLNAKYAEERTTQRYHDVDKFFVGDLLIVTELGRIPETTSDNFVRKHEEATKEEKHRFWTIRKYSLVKRTVSHNVTAYMTKAKPRKPQRILYATDFTIPIKVPARFCNPPNDLPLETFYSATVFTPQVHPGSLLRTIGKGDPKNHVVRITAPVSVKHIHQPVLLKIDTLDRDRADQVEVATNPFGTLDVTNSRAMKALLLSGRLALSAALAANQKFMDTRHYTVTIHAVIPHPRG
uniref:Uncharacterized protein n=1 Tax=Caenorhabditis japonica TaxID=281687 RepID=A0A8R1IM15_CAEJA